MPYRLFCENYHTRKFVFVRYFIPPILHQISEESFLVVLHRQFRPKSYVTISYGTVLVWIDQNLLVLVLVYVYDTIRCDTVLFKAEND